ncbi:unnamed protein product [Cuscuta campestris]|uniref:Uncharacterized protein n=1 Tax=Cuscuta campestris TaxID=132261 RepID=A0A484M1I1_9ASTE|nr:unnamed protein product [Cuscuta campestris]
MGEAEAHQSHPTRPLLSKTTLQLQNDDFNDGGFTFRLVFIAFIALLSIWANHEATKGFAVTVVNDAGGTAAGRRFSLFYESDDRATRLILDRSKYLEDLLPFCPKKGIDHVVLRLSRRNMTSPVVIESGERGEFVIHICPSIVVGPNFELATFLAVQRGMAHIWLWDCHGNNAEQTRAINGVVDCIASFDGAPPHSGGAERPDYSVSGCWMGGNCWLGYSKFGL